MRHPLGLDEAVACAGLLARSVTAVLHVRVAGRSVWGLNEKGLVHRPGWEEVNSVMTGLGLTPEEMTRIVKRMRQILGLAEASRLKFDEVGRQP